MVAQYVSLDACKVFIEYRLKWETGSTAILKNTSRCAPNEDLLYKALLLSVSEYAAERCATTCVILMHPEFAGTDVEHFIRYLTADTIVMPLNMPFDKESCVGEIWFVPDLSNIRKLVKITGVSPDCKVHRRKDTTMEEKNGYSYINEEDLIDMLDTLVVKYGDEKNEDIEYGITLTIRAIHERLPKTKAYWFEEPIEYWDRENPTKDSSLKALCEMADKYNIEITIDGSLRR